MGNIWRRMKRSRWGLSGGGRRRKELKENSDEGIGMNEDKKDDYVESEER